MKPAHTFSSPTYKILVTRWNEETNKVVQIELGDLTYDRMTKLLKHVPIRSNLTNMSAEVSRITSSSSMTDQVKRFFELSKERKNLVDGFMIDDSIDSMQEDDYTGAMASILLHNPIADSERDGDVTFGSEIFKTGSIVDIWVGEGSPTAKGISKATQAVNSMLYSASGIISGDTDGELKQTAKYVQYDYDYNKPYSSFYAARKSEGKLDNYVSGHIFRGVVTNIGRDLISSSGDKLQINSFSLERMISMYKMSPGVFNYIQYRCKERVRQIGGGWKKEWVERPALEVLGYIVAGLLFSMMNGNSWTMVTRTSGSQRGPILALTPIPQKKAGTPTPGKSFEKYSDIDFDRKQYGSILDVKDVDSELNKFRTFYAKLFEIGRGDFGSLRDIINTGVNGTYGTFYDKDKGSLYHFIKEFGVGVDNVRANIPDVSKLQVDADMEVFRYIPEIITNFLVRSFIDCDNDRRNFPAAFSFAFLDPDGTKMKNYKKSKTGLDKNDMEIVNILNKTITLNDSIFKMDEGGGDDEGLFNNYYKIFKKLCSYFSNVIEDVEFYIEPSGLFVYRRKEKLPKELGPTYGSLYTLGENVKEFRINSRADLLRAYSGIALTFKVRGADSRANYRYDMNVALTDQSIEKKVGKRYLPLNVDLYFNPLTRAREGRGRPPTFIDEDEFRTILQNLIMSSSQFNLTYDDPNVKLGKHANKKDKDGLQKMVHEWSFGGDEELDEFTNKFEIWLRELGHELLNFGVTGDIYTVGDPHVRIRNKLYIIDERQSFGGLKNKSNKDKLKSIIPMPKWAKYSDKKKEVRKDPTPIEALAGTVNGSYFVWKVVHYFGVSAGTDGYMVKVYFTQSRRHESLLRRDQDFSTTYSSYGGHLKSAVGKMQRGGNR